MLLDWTVVDEDLSAEVLEVYLGASRLAVDTETMGLIPGRDRLCLVQLCDPEGRVTTVKIRRGQKQAPNLQVLLESVDVIKVFHFARFDLAMLRSCLGISVKPIFCTKVASKLARTYTSRHGLKDLVAELEGIDLDKSAQSSDWGNFDGLSDEQLKYAANDVRYLLSVQEKLRVMLLREERLDLADECMRFLDVMVSLDLAQYKDVFEH